MANKTIHQLTPASTITGDTQFAIYDTVSDSTKKATASQILGTEDILYADDPSTPSGTVDFTTQDTSLNPTSSVSVDLLTGSDSWSQRFVKISQMFKNIRYLLGKLGSTDISSIGDGSVTGAVNTLNSNLIYKKTFTWNKELSANADVTFNVSANNFALSVGDIPLICTLRINGGGGQPLYYTYTALDTAVESSNSSVMFGHLYNPSSSNRTYPLIAECLYKRA